MFNINFVAVSEQHLESIYFSTFEKLLHYTLKTYLVYVLAATKKCGVCVSHPICSYHT